MGHSDFQMDNANSDETEGLRMVHAGRLYFPMRNPLPLIDCLEKESSLDTSLVLVGSLDEYITKSLNKQVLTKTRMRGWLDRPNLERLYRGCNVLVLFGNDSQLQVPGKLYDYLSQRKPILYIHSDLMNDPVLELTAAYNFVFMVSNNTIERDLPQVLEEIREFLKKDKMCNYDDEYHWSCIVDKFQEEIGKLA
jgi:hypothetical protein